MEIYKKAVLKHAFSIAPACVKGSPAAKRLDFKFEAVTPTAIAKDNDFFVFVRRFNAYVYLTVSLVKTKKFSPTSTPFYLALKRRSRFIQLFNFKFSSVFFSQIIKLFLTLRGILLLPIYLIAIWSRGVFDSLHFSSSDKIYSTYKNSFLFRGVSYWVLGAFRLPFHVFDLVKLYLYLFFEYFNVVFRQFYSLLKKSFFFNSYYSYYYFTRRYFFNFFFVRLFSREVEDELDQIKDISDFVEDDNDEDFGPLDFEFQDYPIGFEKSSNYDDYADFEIDNYYDKSYVGVSGFSFFEPDRRSTNNFFFEQLFLGLD